MPVYVDDMRARFGRLVLCHMTATTSEELLAMVDRIRVQRKWIQKPGIAWAEHFDISRSKRKLAVAAGAMEVTWRQMGVRQMLLRRGYTVPLDPAEWIPTARLLIPSLADMRNEA